MCSVTHGSCIRKSGRYFTTGSSQCSLPWSTSLASTLAVIALLLEAILKIDCDVIGLPLPASASPTVRVYVTLPSSITPTATPGRW